MIEDLENYKERRAVGSALGVAFLIAATTIIGVAYEQYTSTHAPQASEAAKAQGYIYDRNGTQVVEGYAALVCAVMGTALLRRNGHGLSL